MQVYKPSSTLTAQISRAEAALRPATAAEIRHALAPLVAANLSNPPPEWQLAQPIYVEVLKEIPIDIVKDAVIEHIRGSEWFPKPAQLLALCDYELEHRRWKLRSLQEAALPPVVAPPEPSEEEKAALDALMAKAFGRDRVTIRRERPSPAEIDGAIKRVAEGLKYFRLPDDDDPVVQEWLRQSDATSMPGATCSSDAKVR
jgi:hypothetical protein